eukprot:TRINITY_DN2129_c0_g1_i1.p1 TRINITY_DN2129_c0_g1~~TRINITY_DN2129_c0_g1_i1.p1  ORF type:complete len:4495 (+),score=1467.97 TRINITY_DN2129_c0_g1_i1:46-13530(+)
MATDARHKWVFLKLGETLGLESAAVQDLISRSNKMGLLTEFFKETGPRKLLFYYQPGQTTNEFGETVSAVDKPKLFVTDGSKEGLRGKCVYFIRITAKAVTTAKIEEEVIYGQLESNFLDEVQEQLGQVLLPALSEQENWGEVPRALAQSEYLGNVQKFISMLNEAIIAMKDNVQIAKAQAKYVTGLDLTPDALAAAANEPDRVEAFEGTVKQWCKQIERVLAESDLIRKESDDVGPTTELEYWKARMAKFNSITDQLKSKDAKLVHKVLQLARSRVLKKWRELDSRITDAANEAKDNVRYLYTFEKNCEQLYKGDPRTVFDSLNNLMQAIKMMHSIARYYNTSERMTTLFVKITNQMILNSRTYLKKGGTLWEQPRDEALSKLRDCIKLKEEYQGQYKKAKHDDSVGKAFDFNEVTMFGKFELFCKRLERLIEMFTTIEQFSSLTGATMENLDPLISRFNDIVNEMKKKPYDLTDHRKNDFDADYKQFCKNIFELETQVIDFVNRCFDAPRNLERSMSLLRQFRGIIQRENLKPVLEQKFMVVFREYETELEALRQQYEDEKDSPPIPRNTPPVSGNIAWARQLLRRIEEPMETFRKHPTILKTLEAKSVNRSFNKLAKAVIGFEILWHQGWCKAVQEAKAGLQATLLVKHPSSGRIYVNFDLDVVRLLREAKALQRMGLDVPAGAIAVLLQEGRLKVFADRLQHMIRRYYALCSAIPFSYHKMSDPMLNALTAKLEPGLTVYTWTSLNIETYLADVDTTMSRLEDLIAKANDILNIRITSKLEAITNTEVLTLPQFDTLCTIDEFAEKQVQTIAVALPSIELKNQEIETAVHDLVRVLTANYDEPQREALKDEIQAFITNSNKALFQAVLSCVRNALHMLRRRFASHNIGFLYIESPVFKVDVELEIPNVVLVPSLEQVQQAVNDVAIKVVHSVKKVYMWNQDRSTTDEGKLKNFFHQLASNKEIVKAVLQLTGSFMGLKRSCSQFLEIFKEYQYLWEGSRTEEMAKWNAGKHALDEYEQQIEKYDRVGKAIDAIVSYRVIGSLSLQTGSIKDALKKEATEWKQMYGTKLNQFTKAKMKKLLDFMDDTTNKLTKKKSDFDLDDVNNMMKTLAELRDMEAKIHMKLAPVQDTYAMLNKFSCRVKAEEQEMVDMLGTKWDRLKELSSKSMDTLQAIAPTMRGRLLSDIDDFKKEVKRFKADYDSRGPMVPGLPPKVASDRLGQFKEMYEDRNRKYEMYNLGERLFGLPITDYPELAQLQRDFKLLERLYGLYNDVINTIAGYADITWDRIDIEKMNQEVTDFQTRQKKMPKQLREMDPFRQAFEDLTNVITDFGTTMPLLTELKREYVLDRHWQRISEAAGVQLDWQSSDFRVKNLLDANLARIKEEVEDTCVAAAKEAEILLKLQKIRDEWSGQELAFQTFKKRGDLMLFPGAMADLMTLLEDTQANLGSLLSNRYNAPFRTELQQWQVTLTTIQERLELWLQVQALWVYLEAVFSGGDIAAQLPQEAKRFQNIDKTWERVMVSARESKNVINFCYKEEMLKTLLAPLQESLEICQKSLSGYLEAKRGIFPRFFFVSDAQLLEILGQGSNPHTIQPHLSSIFDAIAQVEFSKVQRTEILAMYSKEGEHVKLETLVRAEGNIEDWLNKLKAEMVRTVKTICRTMSQECNAILGAADKDLLEQFINKYPAQVSLLGVQLWWTWESEDALSRAKAERGIMAATKKKFDLILRHMVDITVQDLKRMERTRVETLITIHIHQVDIWNEIVKKRLKSSNEFEWLKQTRFYWKADRDDCLVSVTNCDLAYCYEYMGVAERLVITPLTDRIYISCAQAMKMFFGGAPAGPAGTGKTETTKDMGRTCGRYFITINCSDQMDYRAMGKLYKGIAQSGIWCGFDEINRVDLAVLSVVAAQIACVFMALKSAKPTFIFSDGQKIPLELTAGCFITMNPGYAGRTELPENMKALFRTIAVVVPDRQIIMRVRLAASGFQEATQLGKKFFVLYRLCEEQLSKQTHYDFGLRNILSVLRTAGATKRNNPAQKEVMVLMRVLRDMNLSKLVDEDEPLFLSLVQDLFPGITVDKEDYGSLQDAISQVCEEDNLINSRGNGWNLKVIQLYEQYLVRHGLCVMGPSGAGKSAQIHTLAKALTKMGQDIKEMCMNPKAITATQMFGKLDVATNDWTDGIFSALWRAGCKTKPGKMTWIELDGPVDAIWIENLNTVLDDTKTLTLANGDRIIMPATLKLVFEVGNLDNASPATVSRLGMVYIGPVALGWKPIMQAWLRTRRAAGEAETLRQLFEKHIDATFVFLRDNCVEMMDNTQANLIDSMLRLLAGLLSTTEAPQTPIDPTVLTRHFAFALIWSLGATLERTDRAKVHQFLSKAKLDMPNVDSHPEDSVYEYVVNGRGQWEHWSTRVPKYVYPKDITPDYSSVLVPTVDNVRTDFLIEILAKQKLPVLLIGEAGTAKTVTIQKYIGRQDLEKVKSKALNFSSATTPAIVQRNVEASVEKRVGTNYGPPGNKHMIMFIDDINMPEINEWGDQVTNEIVRQLIGRGGFYTLDPKKPGEFSNILDVSFLAAMNQPGGGRNDIPSRLKHLFNIFNVTLPSPTSVESIYSVFAQGHFCFERSFSAEVVATAKKLPEITRTLWEQTKSKMLPTPAKFHYIFNLRDLSRIFQGMLNVTSEVITDPILLLQLWKHEADRVLPDKFTTTEDVAWFQQATKQLLQTQFGDDVAEMVVQPKFFVDFLRDAEEPDDPDQEVEVPKVYEPIKDLQSVRERAEELMKAYNESVRVGKVELVLFDFALMHLMRISRIIRTKRGNALLVGVGGSGKQSLTRLASFIAGYKTFQITMTRTYNVGNLMDDLKALYRMAATVSPVTFLFTDNDVKEEGFLEYLNMILCSGEVAGLFPKDELDTLLDELRAPAKKERPGFIDTNENLYAYFIDKVRDNLHVVLCFSPVGDKFRNRARKFPGLVNGCNIDWFPPWPREALYSVADKYMSTFDVVCEPHVKKALVDHMCHVHTDIGTVTAEYFQRLRRAVYVTPKSYLSFIEAFKKIYSEKRTSLKELADRVGTGLKKLLEASTGVDRMKVELTKKEKELAVAQKKCSEFLVEITQQTMAAQKVKDDVQKVKDECSQTASIIEADKIAAERDLEAAKPALEKAEAALNLIKPSDIATIKKLAKPPPLVKRIMDGVITLRHLRLDPFKLDPDNEQMMLTPTWSTAVSMMNDMKFLNLLQDFPKEQINDETCELLLPYLEMSDFNAVAAAKSCGNIAGLCIWITAMVEYHQIFVTVEPKKAKLRAAESELRIAMKNLAAAQAELDAKQAELNAMQAKYDEAMRQKQELQDDADLTKRRLESAEALINGLGDEKERWKKQVEDFENEIRRLVGDVSLAAAFISYAGPFNQDFRLLLMKEHWAADISSRKMPLTSGLNVIQFLTTESTIDRWNLEGLPRDELSIQNGIIVTGATRFPLMIDPQGQGKSWIKTREKDNKIMFTNLNHKLFRQHLEDALSNGCPLLIEDVSEELDPVLDPILDRITIGSGKRKRVKIGEKDVDWDVNFNLFITTKLPNPHYSPETSAKCSIIDFTVTMRGLEDQLLARVIGQEKADLEESRQALLKEIADCKATAEDCQRQLLFKLSSVQGNLLDDPSVIEVLNKTKAVEKKVKASLAGAEETEKKITQAREEFRPAAHRGSVMYFVITELSMVNPVYNNSLNQFLKLFDEGMKLSKPDIIVSKRVQNIIEFSTFHIYKYIQRGLYEIHKPMYQMLMTLKIDLHLGKIKHSEFGVLLKGGDALDINSVKKKPYGWIPDNAWLNMNALAELPQFNGIIEQIMADEKVWKTWYDFEDPENQEIPAGFQQRCSSFERLLMVRSFREDRMLVAAKRYIINSIGQQYVEGIPTDLEELWSECDIRTPLICLLSAGSDPTSAIVELAKKKKIDLKMVSMGQGQEASAREQVNAQVAGGGWVLLQNCHLALKYLPELEDSLLSLDRATCDPSFRLWITTDPYPNFPINLLQMSIKFTNEPPQGLKAGLRRSYAWINQDMLDLVESTMWTKLLFATCFLHSTVIERKRFGPLGWCIGYEFNHTDLVASSLFLENYLYSMDMKKGISWTTIRYMICEVQYGGRITDDYDKRLLVTYGNTWLDNPLFNAGFEFYAGYNVPEGKNIMDFRNFIDQLPLQDTPQIFGLHPNAELNFAATQSNEILGTIMNVQPKESSGAGGETREETVLRTSSELLKKLPVDFNMIKVKACIERQGGMTPLNVCLRQEVDRMQRVIGLVRRTLKDLQLAIAGTIIMSAELQDALNSLYDARVPQRWMKLSWPSPTLGYWFADVIGRTAQFTGWLNDGKPNAFWLTGFFNPQGFLTAMKQDSTRAHKAQGWALDAVTLQTEVTKMVNKEDALQPPSEGLYIYGMFLEGASWDAKRGRLKDSLPKVLFDPMPIVHVTAVSTQTALDSARFYVCPVYRLPRRTDLNYIFDVTLKTDEPPEKWVLRGVALLTSRV